MSWDNVVEWNEDKDNEKGIGVINKVNEGIVDIVVDREQLKCGYTDTA